jgi:hypothetical protein
MVKECAEAAGFRASIEETALDGDGRVDVILRRDSLTVCVEISVTTTREHEYLNVRKCLEFGCDQMWLVANTERHRAGLEAFIKPKLTEAELEKASFLTPEGVEALLLELAPTVEQKEKVVRGWKVRSNTNKDNRSLAVISTIFR